MSASIVSVDEESLRKDIKNLMRKAVEETLNALVDEEASDSSVPKLRGATFQAGVAGHVFRCHQTSFAN